MQNIVKKIFYFIFIYIPIISNLAAGESGTRYSLTGGIYLNGNIYNSDFSQLGDIPNYNDKFTGTFGLAPGFSAGMLYTPKSPFMGSDIQLSFLLSYVDFSAKFFDKEFFGNIITGNEHTKGIIDHEISPDYSLIAVEPGISFFPLEKIPVGFKLGIFVGFPVSSGFTQIDRIASPGYITFLDGTKEANKYSGDIPGIQSYLLGLTAGTKYKVYENGSFSVWPEINFTYGINNIISTDMWKVSSVRFGVSINYNIPKPVAAPPLDSPAPEMPGPPAPLPPSKMELDLKVYEGSRKLNDGDTIFIPMKMRLIMNNYSLLPILFYKKDRIEPAYLSVDENDSGYDAQTAQSMVFHEIIDYLKSNPEVNVTIEGEFPADEDRENAQARINYIRDKFLSNGIDENRIKALINYTDVSGVEYEEQREESRKVEFSFSDNSKLISFTVEKEVDIKKGKADLLIEPDIKTDAESFSMNGTLRYAGKLLTMFDEGATKYIIDAEKLDVPTDRAGQLHLDAIMSDADNQMLEKHEIINMVYRREIVDTVINNISGSGKRQRQWIIGYCKFDRSDFYLIDEKALDEVKDMIAQGRKLQIVPLTDRIGTEEHNNKLAEKRAEKALKLLDLNESAVDIIFPDSPVFDNNTPYGRKLSRTVIVRLQE